LKKIKRTEILLELKKRGERKRKIKNNKRNITEKIKKAQRLEKLTRQDMRLEKVQKEIRDRRRNIRKKIKRLKDETFEEKKYDKKIEMRVEELIQEVWNVETSEDETESDTDRIVEIREYDEGLNVPGGGEGFNMLRRRDCY